MSTDCNSSLTQLDWIRDLQAAKPTASSQHEGQSKMRDGESSESGANCPPHSSSSESGKNGPNTGKPPYSYATLIMMAIHSSPDGKMSLSEIYQWIMENYQWYRKQPDGASWKNSIRHNLSLNKAFRKIQRSRDDPGKGSYWTIDDRCDSPAIGSECQSPCGASGRKRTRTASDMGYPPDDRFRPNSGGPRVNPLFQHLLPDSATAPAATSRMITVIEQAPLASSVQLVLPVLTTGLAVGGQSAILQHSPVITINEQEKCYCISSIPVMEPATRPISTPGDTQINDFCQAPAEIADLNRPMSGENSPSNLSESFSNLYKDVFNSSLLSERGGDANPCTRSLTYQAGQSDPIDFDTIREFLGSSISTSVSCKGPLECRHQQRRVGAQTGSECLQSLDMTEFQGLVGNMQQRDLDEWLYQCHNSSLAASLRDFLNKSISNSASKIASDMFNNDGCTAVALDAMPAPVSASATISTGMHHCNKNFGTEICSNANATADYTSVLGSRSIIKMADFETVSLLQPEQEPKTSVDEGEDDEFDWEQLVNKD